MTLDMEGEFLKLARKVLGNPQELYRMMTLNPDNMRISVMGVDSFVMLHTSTLKHLLNKVDMKEAGRRLGSDLFGGFMREYSFEVERLQPRQLFEVAIQLARTSGYGDFSTSWGKIKRTHFRIEVKKTLEEEMGVDSRDFTTGLIEGLAASAGGAAEGVSVKVEGGVTILEGKFRA